MLKKRRSGPGSLTGRRYGNVLWLVNKIFIIYISCKKASSYFYKYWLILVYTLVIGVLFWFTKDFTGADRGIPTDHANCWPQSVHEATSRLNSMARKWRTQCRRQHVLDILEWALLLVLGLFRFVRPIGFYLLNVYVYTWNFSLLRG